MRTLTFDQYEFDPPDGEEGLEICIVTRHDRLFQDIFKFATSVWGAGAIAALPEPVMFDEETGPGNVRHYLKHYAGLTLPTLCRWPTYIHSDDWNDWDAILAGPGTLIRYHWWTAA